MIFEWDDEKEKANIIKHGIDFTIAQKVFEDVNRIEYYDSKHSVYEDRYITIGMIYQTITVLTVVYTERPKAIRIISARLAEPEEEKEYYNGYH